VSPSPLAPPADAPTTDAPRQLVSFLVGDQTFGVDVRSVREIRQWSPTTMLPGQAWYSRGVLSIRGEALPVHDLKARFGGPQTEPDAASVVVIVTAGDRAAGLLVDGVSDIIDVGAGEICPVPEGAVEDDDGAILGLVPRADRMIALVDVNRLV
jgi:purine-binding chemotaxis protein CheW